MQKGFSLIELMVSVAIVSILATVAIPNFTSMIYKARQTEAKTMISAMYTAEKVALASDQHYSACLYNVGFFPESPSRYYSVGIVSVGGAGTSWDKYGPSNTTCNTATISSWGTLGWRTDALFMSTRSAKNPSAPFMFIAINGGTTTGFTAAAMGVVNPLETLDDWQIDETGAITHIEL